MDHFGSLMFTADVVAEQAAVGSDAGYRAMLAREVPDGLGKNERLFITTRQSFYLASISSSGWPYVQHRGGPAGFVQVLGPTRIGFGDFKGNRQFVTTGNIKADPRVSLFMMDYPRKARLKILGHMERLDNVPDWAGDAGEGPVPERYFEIEIAAFDWNCPKYIEPRFTQTEIAEMLRPHLDKLEARNQALEAELAELKRARE